MVFPHPAVAPWVGAVERRSWPWSGSPLRDTSSPSPPSIRSRPEAFRISFETINKILGVKQPEWALSSWVEGFTETRPPAQRPSWCRAGVFVSRRVAQRQSAPRTRERPEVRILPPPTSRRRRPRRPLTRTDGAAHPLSSTDGWRLPTDCDTVRPAAAVRHGRAHGWAGRSAPAPTGLPAFTSRRGR